MKIEFNKDNPLVTNWEDTKNKPMLRDDCRGKVLFCVYKLKKGESCEIRGWCDNYPSYTYYKRGCYVIPVILSAHRWYSGNKVTMALPSGLFGMFSIGPILHRVEKKDYEAAENFRPYYGICKNWYMGYDYVSENTELYDNVYEAIASAKAQNARPRRQKPITWHGTTPSVYPEYANFITKFMKKE